MHRQTAAAIAFSCALVAVARAQDPPRFRSGVEVVALDASVVDRTGKPVSGLTPANFRVTADGRERRVVSAQFINYLPTVAATASSPQGDPGVVAVASPPPAARNVDVDVRGRKQYMIPAVK